MTAEAAMPTRRPVSELPREVHLAEFVLSTGGGDPEELAERFRYAVAADFVRRDPIISILYDIEIEEVEVWTGSRKSRNKVRLKRKAQKKGGLWAWLKENAVVIGLGLKLLSTDYEQAGKNIQDALNRTAAVFQSQGEKVAIDELYVNPRPLEEPTDHPSDEEVEPD